MTNHFPKILGQDDLKKQLSFGVECFKAGHLLPTYLFVGGKGSGKSLAAKSLGSAINKIDNEYKWCELNCAIFKKASDFFASAVFLEQILDKKVAVFMDEAHNLPKDMQNIFLTLFQTDGGEKRTIELNGAPLTINLRENIFIFGTSEPDAVFAPLKDRFERAALAPCTHAEIQKIIAAKHPVTFDKGLLDSIASYTRGTPRSAVQMADKIFKFLSISKKNHLTEKDWQAFCKMTNSRIYGLDKIELQILEILASRGPCSLNELRAATNISRQALINEHEIPLTNRNLMRVNVKREITNNGRKVLELVSGKC